MEGIENPVVEISDEKTGELIYCVRINGIKFKPKVFKQSSYKITLTDTYNDITKVISGVLPAQNPDEKLVVKF